MKYLSKLLTVVAVAGMMMFASCSTQRVVVEANTPNTVRLTSQTHGCRFHRSKLAVYWLGGLVGTPSTADIVQGARGPVRIEFKNTPGSVLLTALTYWAGGFLFKSLEVYECPM